MKDLFLGGKDNYLFERLFFKKTTYCLRYKSNTNGKVY